ncbi:tRNA pseudouridine(38-40) synthase TruA [Ruficoccus sp. ZRK36]|uniref:tRNA pseudouridine(38-40) synthase TruA n=1 Tax=Ruficoccus sp. ZRK36 TaxID=2866311 RepID=UPI001C7369EA|nr:tRNA pseudouridine(38-40) synthase TruA [Ruficoccus sp. ZRK36]QYY37101.1 tRNA pseudouridine(38-40) synthase TruA [Ruficoccus sp. ZRK36]
MSAASALRKFKAVCAYDGTDLYGWQSQAGGNTVQDFIEARLAVIFKGPVRIHGSGRTDSGVHSKGQVFHFEAEWPHPPATLLRALRCGLPAGIQVTRLSRAKADFHARFSATGKRYCYRLYEGFAPPWDNRYCWSLGNRRLDTAAMTEAARHFIGQQDFTAFGANRGDGSADNPVKDMRWVDVSRRGHKVTLTFEASGFLYKMARSMTGTLVEVGLGKISPDELATILHGRVRTEQVATAPAKGLWMERVFYGA